MIRKIIHIDEEKCNGCGACVTACHEGAIGLVNGKAKLMRDDYCDGCAAVGAAGALSSRRNWRMALPGQPWKAGFAACAAFFCLFSSTACSS